MKTALFLLLYCLAASYAFAEAITQGSHYVTADKLNVRLSPNAEGTITNKIYRQQKVDVKEVRNGWARISDYYNGVAEGVEGMVARWVSAQHLSLETPSDMPQPELPADPRIKELPRVGEYGATERDVEILYAAATHYLNIGRCQKIMFGDKSVDKPDTYYLNCGEAQNLFFKPSEIPGLDK
jgi:hypothetical protein